MKKYLLIILFLSSNAFAADQCGEAVKLMKEGTTFARGSNREKESYERAIKLCPKLSEAHYNLGLNLLHQNNIVLALKSLHVAIELSAKEEYLVGLGNAYYAKGDKDAAQKNYSSALKLNQNSAGALQGLAVVMSSKGSYKEAQDLLKQALGITPENPELYFNMGIVFEKLGDTSSAIKSFRLALEKKSTYLNAQLGIASIYLAEKKLSDAEGLIKTVLAVNDEHSEAKFLYGQYLLEIGELTKAQEYFERVEKVDPSNTKVLVNLAVILVKQGKVEEGISRLKSASVTYSQDSDVVGALGWAYLVAGDYSLAEKYLNQAYELNPSSRTLRDNLSSLLSATGRETEAKKFQN